MSAPLILGVGVVYLVVAVDQYRNGSPGMASSSPVKKRPTFTRRRNFMLAIPTDAANPVSWGRSRMPGGRI